MASTCVEGRSTGIKQIEVNWNTTGFSSSPFTLSGKAYTTPPTGEQGVTEYKRRVDALKNTSSENRINYLKSDNYEGTNLILNNVLGPEPSTTLRYGNDSYSQKFIAYHTNLWNDTGVSVSLFFESNDGGKLFHICIPVELTNSVKDENIFLKYWLHQNRSTNIPTNLTTNELFNFRNSETTKFYTVNYCFAYNGDRIANTYIFCMFQDSLKLNRTQLPGWMQNDPTMTQTSVNYKKTFDEILNLMLRGKIQNYAAGFVDPPLLSQEKYFVNGTETTLKPIYYTVKTQDLTGKLFKQPFAPRPGKRLQNIKCYPIDLASQVTKDGSIYVDEETQKPIPVDDATGKTERVAYDPDIELKTKEQQDRWIFMIVSIVTFGILFVIGIVIAVFILRGRSVGSLPTPVSTVAASVATP